VGASSTYRLQLTPGFGFHESAQVLEYLSDLGVSHVYFSPYLQSAPGSTHGYDVVDPTRLNDELGGTEARSELVRALLDTGLRQVLDVVPNHMATHSSNPYWWDVLENGPSSLYADFFDVDWAAGDPASSLPAVLVPVLGDQYGRVLEAGDIHLRREAGKLVVCYFEHSFPVAPRSLGEVLSVFARRVGSRAVGALAQELAELPDSADFTPGALRTRHERKEGLLSALGQLLEHDARLQEQLDEEVTALEKDLDALDAFLRRQHYRLAWWRSAGDQVNYRRFFSINSLVGVRVEDPSVFEATHQLVLRLASEETVGGLRIDHVDGLRDPARYLRALSDETPGVPTVVEKILEPGECLPGAWPVAGTTGYDFVARVNNVFVKTESEKAMTDCYVGFTGETGDYEEVVETSKKDVMHGELFAEVERVVGLLSRICEHHRRERDTTRRQLRSAVEELVAHFPVYRTYVSLGAPVTEQDAKSVTRAAEATRRCRPEIDRELLEFLADLALGGVPGTLEAEFAARFPQLTAPVMAKGAEDTAFYRYNRLVSLNEVGGDPGLFGHGPDRFHAETCSTAQYWPDTMLTLSTHDTKRSADTRARINVLSTVPQSWARSIERWAEIADKYRTGSLPDRNMEYLLYQTLVGTWPIDVERLAAYMSKAAKEAKSKTSWTDPDPGYDAALDRFVRSVHSDEELRRELVSFMDATRVVELGRRSSLAQVSLLLTCPGNADVYRGDELWDLSLVDPDNRRPVDFDLRRHILADSRADGGRNGDVGGDQLGSSKLRLVARLLGHRRARPEPYESSEYEPLSFHGPRSGEVLGFRRPGLFVVVPLSGGDDWAGTTVDVPPGDWKDVVTGGYVSGGTEQLSSLFGAFPVAVLAAGVGRS
jgi:(1->4)-alpha-D-glucan 1-alpha-D-glucosylmutase